MNYNIEWKGSPNFRPQTGVKKEFIVFHWIVGSLNSATAIFQNAERRVATNYGVGEGKIHQYVQDKDYAFGSGTTFANKHGISIEHEGGWLLKNGNRKKPTKKTLETSAWLCAKIAREHKMGQLVPFKNAFPHSHFVSTGCPGTLDWKYICKRANEINAELAKPAPVAPVKPVEPAKPVVVAPTPTKPPVAPTKPTEPKKEYITIVKNDSYWNIASKLLKTKNAVKIIKEVARLQKLNNNKRLFPGEKLRIK
jgi:LysM repeat protein